MFSSASLASLRARLYELADAALAGADLPAPPVPHRHPHPHRHRHPHRRSARRRRAGAPAAQACLTPVAAGGVRGSGPAGRAAARRLTESSRHF